MTRTLKKLLSGFYDNIDVSIDKLANLKYVRRFREKIESINNLCNLISDRVYYLFFTIYSIFFTFVSFNVINFQSRTYDYVFHLSRIVGLAESIRNWDFLPNLNYIYAYGTGYASPMFYGNWQFYPSALVYIATKDGNLSYSIFALLIILFTLITVYFVVTKISKNKLLGVITAITVPCYYTLFGYGMTMVIPLVSLLFYSVYRVLFINKRNPIYLGVIIALLIQTHILSTIILAIFSFIFLLLNYKKLTMKKLVSFGLSVLIALFLSAGYIFQYVEQVSSQHFLFSWLGRNFPVNVNDTFSVPYPFQSDKSGFYKPFTPLEWPIHQIISIGMIFSTLIVVILYRHITSLSKTLFLSCWILYLSATSLLPWNSILKQTFLGSMQYSGRLLFFIPFIFILFLAFVNRKGFLLFLMCIISLTFYFSRVLPQYSISSNTYSQMENENKLSEEMLKTVYMGDKSIFVDTSGDEYYNIDVDNVHVRSPQFSEFMINEGVSISNVKKSYNLLEFDVDFKNNKNKNSVIVPLIWYKGYQVEYSKGGSGSKAMMETRPFSVQEIQENRKLRKPNEDQKVLNDGKVYLELKKPGHISISYHKTFLQFLGYFIEIFSWLSLFAILVMTSNRCRKL
jgi:hypothetical protein